MKKRIIALLLCTVMLCGMALTTGFSEATSILAAAQDVVNADAADEAEPTPTPEPEPEDTAEPTPTAEAATPEDILQITEEVVTATYSETAPTLTMEGEEVAEDVCFIDTNKDGNMDVSENGYSTLAAAVAAANDGDTITLLANVALTDTVKIEKALTIDGTGADSVFTISTVAQKAFEVHALANATEQMAVTFKNVAIINSASGGRCIDTRTGNITLTLDTVTLTASNAKSQPLTIGGSESGGLTVNITGSTISAGSTDNNQYGYGIISFVPVALTITSSTVTGRAAVYMKSGSEGSKVTITDSTLNGANYSNDTDYAFGPIALEDKVEVTVTGTSTVTATGTNQSVICLGTVASGGSAVTVEESVALNGDILHTDTTVVSNLATTAPSIIVPKAYQDDLASEGYVVGANGQITAVGDAYLVKIGENTYGSLADAIAAANNMTFDEGTEKTVTVEIYGKTEYTDATDMRNGSYTTMNFIGKTDDAEISITRNGPNGYISGQDGSAVTVNFENLTLSKPEGSYATDAGFMNVYFTVYRVAAVNYTNCVFPDGACAQNCKATYTKCTFKNDDDSNYNLWIYAGVNGLVDECTFEGIRGIKMYVETGFTPSDLTVQNTVFKETVTKKPAIVLTYGNSVTLQNNTYSSTGVFELDNDGAPNGVTVTADITDIACMNDNYTDCGVLVDGKIYTTITAANTAGAIKEGSTVTLMYDSTETVELPAGVTLNKNGYAAEGVTVPATKISATQFNLLDVNETFISTEILNLNAKESVVIKLYSGETLLATTELTNKEYLKTKPLSVKICLTGSSNSWETAWEKGHPRADVRPNKVVLFVDGYKMDEAEVKMIKTDGETSVNWADIPGVNPAEESVEIKVNGVSGRSYICTIAGVDLELEVLVIGGTPTSVILPHGTYTVALDTNWNWRNKNSTNILGTLEVNSKGDSVTLNPTVTNNQWFSGTAAKVS